MILIRLSLYCLSGAKKLLHASMILEKQVMNRIRLSQMIIPDIQLKKMRRSL